MKTLKILCILFFSLLINSCSNNSDDGGSAPEASFTGIINGGPFENYTATLGSYSTDSSLGLNLAILDANGNTIRLFMNKTGGLAEGTIKVMGNIDDEGFVTNALVHHPDSQTTFNASEGNITISENRATPGEEYSNIISGNFTLLLNNNNGTSITLNGTFNNFEYNTF